MPFKGKPTQPVQGHFCYGLWKSTPTTTMKWLREQGCISPFDLGAGQTPSGKPGPTPLEIASLAVFGGKHPADDIHNSNKRRSKVGLALCAHHSIPVHFALDLLNMEEVTNKSYPNETETKRIITNAELRFVFRFRSNVKMQNCIQFWLDKSPVAPPWDDTSTAYHKSWGVYEKHLGNKQSKNRMELDLSSVHLTGLELYQ